MKFICEYRDEKTAKEYARAIAQFKMKIQLLKRGQTDGKVFIQNAIVDTGFNG